MTRREYRPAKEGNQNTRDETLKRNKRCRGLYSNGKRVRTGRRNLVAHQQRYTAAFQLRYANQGKEKKRLPENTGSLTAKTYILGSKEGILYIGMHLVHLLRIKMSAQNWLATEEDTAKTRSTLALSSGIQPEERVGSDL